MKPGVRAAVIGGVLLGAGALPLVLPMTGAEPARPLAAQARDGLGRTAEANRDAAAKADDHGRGRGRGRGRGDDDEAGDRARDHDDRDDNSGSGSDDD